MSHTKSVSTSVCGEKDEHLHTCSDCQAALQASETLRVTLKLVWECQEALGALSNWNKVTYLWFPVTVGFRVMKMWVYWLRRDKQSIPWSQIGCFDLTMLIGSRLRSDCMRGTLNTELLHQVWGSQSSLLEDLWINYLKTYWPSTGNNTDL